jgi:hypothetical protein
LRPTDRESAYRDLAARGQLLQERATLSFELMAIPRRGSLSDDGFRAELEREIEALDRKLSRPMAAPDETADASGRDV